ncbi:unnamed protein product [Prorocentrum cordatum]|uniref:Uncharacterized protein n=1 Tax=Prorocentrum cordatum TaxID=2364126 RepID=A0ABN9Y0G7_9DINO|nr:unnamed protein product [Polarella glacialis]
MYTGGSARRLPRKTGDDAEAANYRSVLQRQCWRSQPGSADLAARPTVTGPPVCSARAASLRGRELPRTTPGSPGRAPAHGLPPVSPRAATTTTTTTTGMEYPVGSAQH